MSPLPAHARVLGHPDLWLEGAALEQLDRVTRLPRCVAAVGLPDLHAGPGIPIGAAFAFDGVGRPLLVGGDAGCGVRLVAVPRPRARGDALVRRVEEVTAGPALPDADAGALLAAVWTRGPRGLVDVPGVPDTLAAFAAREPVEEPLATPAPDAPELGAALGTIGGGNHFLEAGEVTAVHDRDAAEAAGLGRRSWAVLAHSGSRGLGRWLLDQWGDVALEGAVAERYLDALAGAVRFARANRLVLAWRMLVALGCARPGRTGPTLDLVHNDVRRDAAGRWLHRKGAAPAEAGHLTVVLGSRGAPTHVLRGAGAAACLCTVAHGAGRRMGRSEAVAKLQPRLRRKQLTRTPHGGHILCDDPRLLYAEHPDAYKPIEPVIAALEDAGAATRVVELMPRVTVKR